MFYQPPFKGGMSVPELESSLHNQLSRLRDRLHQQRDVWVFVASSIKITDSFRDRRLEVVKFRDGLGLVGATKRSDLQLEHGRHLPNVRIGLRWSDKIWHNLINTRERANGGREVPSILRHVTWDTQGLGLLVTFFRNAQLWCHLYLWTTIKWTGSWIVAFGKVVGSLS